VQADRSAVPEWLPLQRLDSTRSSTKARQSRDRRRKGALPFSGRQRCCGAGVAVLAAGRHVLACWPTRPAILVRSLSARRNPLALAIAPAFRLDAHPDRRPRRVRPRNLRFNCHQIFSQCCRLYMKAKRDTSNSWELRLYSLVMENSLVQPDLQGPFGYALDLMLHSPVLLASLVRRRMATLADLLLGPAALIRRRSRILNFWRRLHICVRSALPAGS